MRSFKNLLASFDSFGEPIQLNFKGQSSYKTCSGGLITLAALIVASWPSLGLFMSMINYEDPTIKMYTISEVPSPEP